MTAGARTLYDAAGRPRRVWLLLALAAACAAWSCYEGAALARTYGLRPADGGVLAPPTVRLAWGAAVAGLALAFFAGMLVYARCYVTRLVYDGTAGTVRVRTLLPPVRVVAASAFGGGALRRGRSHGRIPVDAPWASLRVRGRRLPYILDLQGDVADPPALRRLVRGELHA